MLKKLICFLIFIQTSLVAITSVAESTPHERKGLTQENFVMIFSSYSYNNYWASSVAKEIQKELEKADPNIFMRITYADIGSRESFISERLGMQAAFSKGRAKRDLIIPSTLIFIGEEAWMFYRIMNLRQRWDTIPIIVCGTRPMILNDYNAFYKKNKFENDDMIPIVNSKRHLRVTGIYKPNNTTRTIEMIKTLIPDVKELTYISTGNYSDEYTLFLLKNDLVTFFSDIKLNVIRETVLNADSINKALTNLPEKTAVLTQSYQPKQTNVPVFTFNDHRPNNDFVVGGFYSQQNDYALKVADLLMKIRNGENPNNIPFEYLNNNHHYLNKTALERFGLLGKAKMLDDTEFINKPPSFFVRNIRTLTTITIALIIAFAFVIIHYFAKRYQLKLLKSHDEYKKLYTLFQIIYDNIPVGIIHFDAKGNVINRNSESDLIFNVMDFERQKKFNLFETDLFNNNLKKDLANNDEVIVPLDLNSSFFQIIFRKIPEKGSINENILAIIIDKTDLEREKKEADLLSSIFDFAINAVELGVSEYNFVSKTGYASKAWYKNLGIKEDTPFDEIFSNVRHEDVVKIQTFWNEATQKKAKHFDQNIIVENQGKAHWLRFVSQQRIHTSKQGFIQFVGLCINIDELIAREQELLSLLRKAKESDRLKNEFVANLKNDIRMPLDHIIKYSGLIINSENKKDKNQYNKILQQNNEILLKLIHETVEKAKIKSEEIEK
jgi:PAS domain-containing protein